MQITISSPELESFLVNQVNSGSYISANQAIEAAVMLLKKQSDYIKFIQNAVDEADDDIKNNNIITSTEFESYFEKTTKDL
jgi:Arc/MetJ-type ribon-helix-helix transcriptional regulator